MFAVLLFGTELGYHILYYLNGKWDLVYSLPIELCSFALLASIILLWTGNKHVFDFVFFAGIAGALQAILTPVLDYGFPHYRFFHFFFTHIGIMLTAFYFMWIKGYIPTFKGVIKTMIILNILLPFVIFINHMVEGNYMFLSYKPATNSLLDVLGPYPWYIFSLEAVAFVMFVILWVLFRKWRVE